MAKPDKNDKKNTAAAPVTTKSKPAPEPVRDATETSASGWGAVTDAVKKAKEGGVFVKLEDDGESFTGVFVGEPLVRHVVFENSEFKKKGGKDKPSTRIALNVAVIDEKTKEITGVKVYEAGPMFFKKMLTVKEKFALDKWAITVTRNGKARDPKTDYVILPDHQLSPAEIGIIGELELHDLEALGNPESFDTDKLDEEEAAQ